VIVDDPADLALGAQRAVETDGVEVAGDDVQIFEELFGRGPRSGPSEL
jgi:hypothetical protein